MIIIILRFHECTECKKGRNVSGMDRNYVSFLFSLLSCLFPSSFLMPFVNFHYIPFSFSFFISLFFLYTFISFPQNLYLSGTPQSTPFKQLFAYVRFEVFTAMTMKSVVLWDIKTQFVLHRRHITSPLQSPAD
jgi:hypothetical protein